MLALISPAKKLDFSPAAEGLKLTAPQLLAHSRVLSEVTRTLEAKEIQSLMKLSENLARLNFERFQSLDLRVGRPPGSKQAVLAFDGDTYSGLRATEFDAEELSFAQEHLGILSGLYGFLRPLDAILPYRLEMGTRLKTARGSNLYAFWGEKVARKVESALKKMDSSVVVNLASNEYFSVIPSGALDARIVTPVFKEIRGGVAKVISFSAKRARGAMARYLIQGRLKSPEDLKKFRVDGYRFNALGSSENEWLFLRDQPAPL